MSSPEGKVPEEMENFSSDSTPSAGAARVARAGAVPRIEKVPGFVFQYLATTARLEFLLITVNPQTEGETYTHAGEETHHVLSGRLQLTVEGEQHELHPGDTIWYPSTIPHKWANPWDEPVQVLSVAAPRSYISTVLQ